MFFIRGDITIHTRLELPEAAAAVARGLVILPFLKDKSGRWEEQEVYVSNCFGLEFVLGHLAGSPPGEYGLSIASRTDQVRYEGMEVERVDATEYVLELLKREPALEAMV